MGFCSGAEPEEFDADIFGVLTVGGENAGKFRCIAASNKDLWQWNPAPFPPGGFSFKMTSTTGSLTPTLTYTDYPFSSSKSVPQAQWPGNSKIYSIKKNGTLIGWFEAKNGNNPDLMWWSNGTSLVSNHITLKKGDVLAFVSSSLPTSKQFPLSSVQT